MEDKDILALFLSRDENAVRQTELKYSGYLLTIALNILGNREDSGECVNDTYFKAWNTIPPNIPARLRYYLGKITRELSIDRLRKKLSAKRGGNKNRTEYELSLDELEECVPQKGTPEEAVEISLLAETINVWLRSCGTEMRDVFMLRYYFCDSVKSIAASSGMSESKVKSMLFRAREGLRKHLEKEGFSV